MTEENLWTTAIAIRNYVINFDFYQIKKNYQTI